MSEEYCRALGRALASYAQTPDGSLESFFRQAAWEIFHLVDSEFSALAFVVKRSGGDCFVGRPGDVQTLPVDVLLGFIPPNGAVVPCQIRDHALDTVRFIDSHVRTSIAAQVVIPEASGMKAEGVLWFGTPGSASRERIELARSVADTTTAWLRMYAPVLQALVVSHQRVAVSQERIREMISIAHDARAPLGALKYLMAEVGSEHPELLLDWRRIGEEVWYVERLLARFAPAAESSAVLEISTSDVSEVLARVAERFQPEVQVQGGKLIRRLPYLPLAVRIAPLDLERVCSNIVANAGRHAGQGPIVIEVIEKDAREVVIRISDSGPGFSQSVIDHISRGVASGAAIRGSVGWGVGLLSCRDMVRRYGGRLVLSSTPEGSTVEIVLPRAEGAVAGVVTGATLQESEKVEGYLPTDAQLIIVDDDVGHSESLERILRRDGIVTQSVDSVDAAIQAIESGQWHQLSVLCDANMPDGGAERLLREVGRQRRCARIAVISGEDNECALYRFAALGAREFFAKPVVVERLVSWVKGGQSMELDRKFL